MDNRTRTDFIFFGYRLDTETVNIIPYCLKMPISYRLCLPKIILEVSIDRKYLISTLDVGRTVQFMRSLRATSLLDA